MKNRIGKFSITGQLLSADPELVKKILATTVVVRCEHDFARDLFEYTALCDVFGEHPKGWEIPFYTVQRSVDSLKTGVTWKTGGRPIDLPPQPAEQEMSEAPIG